jgi:outer membrane protein assembly factor BamD (BamD/ComL family)
MKRALTITLFFFALIIPSLTPLQAKKWKKFRCQEEADNFLITHYNAASESYNKEEWRSAAKEFEKVVFFFPDAEQASEASYYLGVCYYKMREFDFANYAFSNYLKTSDQPLFFENTIYYKYCIAEYFRKGIKKHPLTLRYLPRCLPADDLALTIYDEIIASFPNHDLTICALWGKADILDKMREYRYAVESYQTIIRRFPRNEIIPECYLKIAQTYYEQSHYEFQNPDILAMAELNAKKFREEFPRDERVDAADRYVSRIKELYAKGLCDLGMFYARRDYTAAAAIYFQSAIEEFPETQVAKFCRCRLAALGYNPEVDEAPITTEEEVEPNFKDRPESAFDRSVPYEGVEGAEPIGMGIPLIVEGGTREEMADTYNLDEH